MSGMFSARFPMREDQTIDTAIRTLGPSKLESRLPYRTWADDVQFRILVDDELSEESGSRSNNAFEAAGPRRKLYFDTTRAKCAIVTCGGL